MLQLLGLIMGEDALNQCRSEGLPCSSVLRATGAWHSVGLDPTWLAQVDVVASTRNKQKQSLF